MILTLNTESGVLHRSKHCAGRDDRFHYVFYLEWPEELVGFIGLRFERLCRKCYR